MTEKRTWTTEDEIGYIRGLGTWAKEGKRLPHKFLVEKYRQNRKYRAYWGMMDKKRIMEVVLEELNAT